MKCLTLLAVKILDVGSTFVEDGPLTKERPLAVIYICLGISY